MGDDRLARRDLIAGTGFEPVKDEARTRAGFATVKNGARVFIKRFDAGTRARGLWDRVRGSRAARSVAGAALLRSRGFRCPEPYAAIDARRGGSIVASYLISEPLERASVLSAFIRLNRPPMEPGAGWRRRTLAAVAREVRRLHDAGLFTSDLQETNLMLEEAGGELRIYFVDLDGFRSLRRVGWQMRERNLVQLDRSIGRFLNRAARLRFLYAYLGGRPERVERRRVVTRFLDRKAREDRKRESRRAKGSDRRGSPPWLSPPR